MVCRNKLTRKLFVTMVTLRAMLSVLDWRFECSIDVRIIDEFIIHEKQT